MLIKTKGIVFRAIKHKETSLILHVYTLEKGLRSFIVNGVRKSKSKMGASLFQVGTLLNLDVYFHENKEINRIKEAKPLIIYREIPFNVVRGGLMLFMVEIMNKCIWESEKNERLFQLLESTLTQLDDKDIPVTITPIVFLMKLCLLLGFFPHFDTLIEGENFDMVEMEFVKNNLKTDTYFNSKMCQYISNHKNGLRWDQNMLKEERIDFLEKWLTYYKIHVHNFQSPNSYEILKEIFS